MERSGVINIYKEAGYTSHDVVAKLRGILKQKKIGHTGTLDPQAQGVLPVCLGKEQNCVICWQIMIRNTRQCFGWESPPIPRIWKERS